MKEINYKEMQFNPFNLIGNDWMLVTAGNQQSGCNTMTVSWGHLGCLWGQLHILDIRIKFVVRLDSSIQSAQCDA